MSVEHPAGFISAGATVTDVNGTMVGVVRAVYPHYVAVSEQGERPLALRVPIRAITRIAGDQVHLSVPKDVLDPMTAEELAAFGLPEHGGEISVVPPLAESQVEAAEGAGMIEDKP